MASDYPDKLRLLFYIKLCLYQSLDFGFGRLVLDSNFVIVVRQTSENGLNRLVKMAAELISMAADARSSSCKISLVQKLFGAF